MKNYRLIFMPSQFLFFKYLTHTHTHTHTATLTGRPSSHLLRERGNDVGPNRAVSEAETNPNFFLNQDQGALDNDMEAAPLANLTGPSSHSHLPKERGIDAGPNRAVSFAESNPHASLPQERNVR